MHEGRRQTGRRPAHAGSRLKLIDVPGRSRLIRQPSSRTGENPPYGMIGGIEETSASFEARSAPRSHPTGAVVRGFRRYTAGTSFIPGVLYSETILTGLSPIREIVERFQISRAEPVQHSSQLIARMTEHRKSRSVHHGQELAAELFSELL